MKYLRSALIAAAILNVSCSSVSPSAKKQQPVQPAMEEVTPAAPVIPDRTFKLADYGAVGDGKTMNTDAFKKAIQAVSDAGGGTLIVPEGVFKTLNFQLVSHLNLHLEAGAVIKMPELLQEYGIADPNLPTTHPNNEQEYAHRQRPAPLISCPRGTTDLAITGAGTIDGSGAIFWAWSDKASRKYPPGRTIVSRPSLLALNATRLHVEGITLTNSPMFHLLPKGEDILIENIRIVAPSDAPNSDAIDPTGNRIVIRNCEIDTGDDDIAVQHGSTNVLIEDMTILHGHGISIGSGTANGVSHMIVRRCTFDGTDNGLRIKSYRGKGGEVHDINYSDITMKNVRRPFDINMRYNGNANVNGDVGPRDSNGQDNIPNFHDIHVRNLTISRSPIAGRIVGIPEQPANDISFDNVKIQSDRGFYVEDAKGIAFTNATIKSLVGNTIVTSNAVVNFNGQEKTGDGSSGPFYNGN